MALPLAEKEFEQYIGRERQEVDEVSAPLYRRLAALLDLDPETIIRGRELPLGWSSLLFPEIARQSKIGKDGHPVRGDFLPPVELPNRRFATRKVRIHRPISIGDRVHRRSTIESIQPKRGRSGPLVFVTIKHDVLQADDPAYVEHQTVVYLGDTNSSAPPSSPSMPTPSWQEQCPPDAVWLFRYSALTFNGHRIHYDLQYAREQEDYPALVVNGGLTALLLLEMGRSRVGRKTKSYEVKAISPLFEGRAISLNGAPTDDGALLWATDCDGRVAMKINLRTE